MKKFFEAMKQEVALFNFRYQLVRLVLSIFPAYTAFHLRAAMIRLVGFSIGKRTIFFDAPQILGHPNIYKQFSAGEDCLIGPGCYIDLAGKIIFEDHVSVGPQVMFITGTHSIGPSQSRLGQLIMKDIVIGSGTWIGARCTILPGVTIGKGAVIAAGAVVTKDIPPNSLAAGIPARVVRQLDD
jgi:maltose O-acetyltransferase